MKIFKRWVAFAFLSAVIFSAVYFIAIPVISIYQMEDEIRLTEREISRNIEISPSNFAQGKFNETSETGKEKKTWVELKLFGFIPVKRILVSVMPYDTVIAGGEIIGFNVRTNGVIVTEPANGYKKGDIITSYKGNRVNSANDFWSHIDGRISMWVKDETSGIGTITYINPETNNFAALGHKLVDYETGASVNVRSGDVYNCDVHGIKKSKRAAAGEIESSLRKSDGIQGSILSSNENGIFGCLNADSNILQKCKTIYPIASRFSVRPGRAKILCGFGDEICEYDIEIIRAKNQRNTAGKGLVIRITDKRLLEKTGGIIHGMSGSPIIQNGHIVGAVTHVIKGDCATGFGVYIDFILP